ncbi:hypothetical protein [Pantanalinema sp. GBBB05]|uniref:hypothetical protein n=1 Tax=Pantanalinema sp. GBBB05 TaxID=2604139 RepID=UPI001DC2F32F|nr:hypothetical protein [Pantanalinema sp. GBBB05]
MEEASNVEVPAVLELRTVSVSVGSIVNYVLPDGRSEGQIRPAIVVRKWSDTCVNLQVLTDGDNDYPGKDGTLWKTSVTYSEDKLPYTWHFWTPE